ncbi:hypothetical protein [Actinacidiphila paucisporea]|uniref:Uncharacterized protein n=1 Tax=Actinacidiphila paucisporea TaxID=310782 RepID=A0A1M7H7S2_9ACTN|nr:hypothetical protein [Actinacidiphila paucisporea]SHM24664.1 hypothetical protein SAMN05216499_109189 [Actinacidiphila paucisporea]
MLAQPHISGTGSRPYLPAAWSPAPAPATAAAHPSKPRQFVYAYITSLDGHVFVIDTMTNSVLGIATTTVGGWP